MGAASHPKQVSSGEYWAAG